MQISPDSDSLNPNGNGNQTNALKDFQLSGDVKSKSDKKFGEKIVLQCEQIINSSYFTERNARFALNRALYTGRMNMTKFMDFFDMNGKTNYVNINWKSIMVVNTIVSRLVGRWMTKKQKATVTATDIISIKEKKSEYDAAEFYLYNKKQLEELQQESGVNIIPQDQFIPEDKDHLELWAAEEQRIPQEILYEQGINTVFDENGWGDMGVYTRKQKIDSAVVGLIGTETIADRNGKIRVIYHRPEDLFYSYSEQDDFKDADIKGVIVSYKISDIRELYPKLKPEELMDIAKSSKQWQTNNKITYNTATWTNNMSLPIDDWNVDVVKFTLKSLDNDKNLIKTAKDGSLYVDKPKKRIEEVYPGNEYVEKDIWNIYRGVYVKNSKFLLEWGLEKNMIRPQDYEHICDVYSPFSFYMYQNNQMRNLAVPEKIEEPVEMMILTRLRIQHFLAKMRPSGYMYDVDGLQEMDLGNGIAKPLELSRVTDQTGNVYYRSRDREGNRLDAPIKPTPPNSANAADLQQLIETYNYHLQVLRDEIGINEFAEGQTIKPRVGVENVQTSMEISFNATDYMNDACVSCTDESAGKIACLLHDSVEYGSKAYSRILKEEDVVKRNFSVKIEMLPTTEEITKLMQDIDNYVVNHPDFILYISPFKIRQIAKSNLKLAHLYFERGQKKAIEGQMMQAQQSIKDNGEEQRQSAIVSEGEKRKTLQMELDVKTRAEMALSQSKKEEALITLFSGILSKGIQVPAEWKAAEQQTIENLIIPLVAKNKQNTKALQQEVEQEQQEQMQGEGMGQEQPMPEEGMGQMEQQEPPVM